MRFTRARDLVLVSVIAAVGVNVLLVVGYDSLPPLPTLAGGTLFVLAVLELVFALVLRPSLARKPGTRPVPPLQAVRVVALAKASSLLGAIMGGAALGALVYLLPKRAQLTVAGHDTTNAVITLISAAALIAAALWLEHCCRAPEDRDDTHSS